MVILYEEITDVMLRVQFRVLIAHIEELERRLEEIESR